MAAAPKKAAARVVTRGADDGETITRESPVREHAYLVDVDPAVQLDRLGRDANVIRNRSGQEVGLKFTGNEDKFAFDRSIIPAGWTYEWKTRTVKNWEWVDHQVELAQNGWEPVPAERHPGQFMPRDYKGPIERGGMILMERDDRLTHRARMLDKKMANEQVQVSRNMAGLHNRSAPGALAISDYSHPEAARATGVKIDRQARVADSQYSYQIDEE